MEEALLDVDTQGFTAGAGVTGEPTNVWGEI